jgi:hypothetical protein
MDTSGSGEHNLSLKLCLIAGLVIPDFFQNALLHKLQIDEKMKHHKIKIKLFRILVPILTLLLGSALLNSCYYDNEEYLYPTNSQQVTCDSISVTFSANIAPIFAGNCNGCHSTASHPNTDVITDNYASDTTYISRIWYSINHIGPFPMPKNGGKLSKCDIAKINQWRNLGMPNN